MYPCVLVQGFDKIDEFTYFHKRTKEEKKTLISKDFKVNYGRNPSFTNSIHLNLFCLSHTDISLYIQERYQILSKAHLIFARQRLPSSTKILTIFQIM